MFGFGPLIASPCSCARMFTRFGCLAWSTYYDYYYCYYYYYYYYQYDHYDYHY